MIKWIVLGVLLYLICGCIVAFVLQQFHNSENPDINFWGIHADEVPIIIVVWAMYIPAFFVLFVGPALLMGLYKLVVTVIFLIIALFKKGDKDD